MKTKKEKTVSYRPAEVDEAARYIFENNKHCESPEYARDSIMESLERIANKDIIGCGTMGYHITTSLEAEGFLEARILVDPGLGKERDNLYYREEEIQSAPPTP